MNNAEYESNMNEIAESEARRIFKYPLTLKELELAYKLGADWANENPLPSLQKLIDLIKSVTKETFDQYTFSNLQYKIEVAIERYNNEVGNK